MSPDGRFLFAANQSHDSLATIALQPGRGKMFLRRLDQLAAGPEMLAMEPGGGALLTGARGALALDLFQVEGCYAMLTHTSLAAPFRVGSVG